MPEIATILASWQTAIRFLESIGQRASTVQIDQALQSLREILFLPEEVRGTINSIAQGDDINLQEAKETAAYFRRLMTR